MPRQNAVWRYFRVACMHARSRKGCFRLAAVPLSFGFGRMLAGWLVYIGAGGRGNKKVAKLLSAIRFANTHEKNTSSRSFFRASLLHCMGVATSMHVRLWSPRCIDKLPDTSFKTEIPADGNNVISRVILMAYSVTAKTPQVPKLKLVTIGKSPQRGEEEKSKRRERFPRNVSRLSILWP